MPITGSDRQQILIPGHIAALRPYEPGLPAEEIKRRFGFERVVKLASNENPLGTSLLALDSMRASMTDLSRYPSGGLELRRRLAETFDVRFENVIVGSGSEGIMANIVRTFLCDHDEILSTEAAFLGFQVLAKGRGVEYRTVPYRDYRYDLPRLADAIQPNTKLIYLANPNNPTGTFFTRQEFLEFHRRVPGRVLIILDEAYYEFAMTDPKYPDSMHYRFDNVITLRTFSKAYGLAAARIGYGFGHADLIATLLKVKLPFEPGGLSEAAALGALEDREFVLRTVANNAAGLAYLDRTLPRLGFRVIPSAANFVMVEFDSPQQANALFGALLRHAVIVRPLAATGLPSCLRISIGTPEENEFLISALSEVQEELELHHAAIK
jgi:histidinol-phosphate aminotransferase